MKLRLDLHLHSIFSNDSRILLADAIEKAKALNLDGFAVTDHDSVKSHKEIRKLSSELIIIPGIEISSSDGHILGYGTSENIPKGLSAAETIDRIRNCGGVAVVAHVMRRSNTVREKVIRQLKPNALEVLNSSTFSPIAFSRAFALALELAIPQSAGSDAHVPGTIGRAYTVVEAESATGDSVIRAIKEGRISPEGIRDSIRNRFSKMRWEIKRRVGREGSSFPLPFGQD